MLGTAVGKSNIVRSRHNTGSISSLSSVEVSLGVVISNSVGVGVRLINMGGLNIRGCGVCRGGMDDRGMVDNWGMVDSMSDWVGNESVVGKTMMGCAMGDNSTMSMNSLVGR